MTTILLTIYVLIWPLIAAGVLAVISIAFYKEWRKARAEGRPMV